ncbi:MAG TPA: amidohydrolase [Phycisphaerales bacterium]|nr:amidohydrolase [Phycisphaerales bacterium]
MAQATQTMSSGAGSAVSREDLRGMIAAEMTDLVRIRRDLHAHPELGYEEQRTSKVVQEELKKAGVPFVADLAGGTGVLGHIAVSGAGGQGAGTKSGAVGLRADMDALPIEEQTGLPSASMTKGKMHACGHDGHTTMLIGAARVLAKIVKQKGGLPRPVSFVFQPAEEGGAGAKKRIEDGCLEGDAAKRAGKKGGLGAPITEMFGLHGWPRLPLGVVGTRKGPLLAASDRFDIHVKGVGSHAAWPHASRDAVVAAAHIVTSVQTIVSRNTNPLDSVVVSITMLKAGSAFNVIPPSATISGTVRTLLPETLKMARQRLEEIAKHTAAAFGCMAELDYRLGYPVTLNDEGAVEVFNAVARETIGEQRVVDIPQPVMGGEDFSFYSQVVPACFFVLGLIPEGKKEMPDLHQPDFNFNDDAMATGIELFCRLAMR